jgi:hypothetical protein
LDGVADERASVQFFCMMLFGPLMATQQGLAVSELPAYIANGVGMLLGRTSVHDASFIQQWIPIVYIAWNLFFNVIALIGLRVAGAATMTLFMTAAVPMAIAGFTCSLPLIGKAPPLDPRCDPTRLLAARTAARSLRSTTVGQDVALRNGFTSASLSFPDFTDPVLLCSFWIGTAALIAGMMMYNSPQIREVFGKDKGKGAEAVPA